MIAVPFKLTKQKSKKLTHVCSIWKTGKQFSGWKS